MFKINIIVIRHGETDWNKNHLLQGHKDIELNSNGRNQASKLKKVLENETFDLFLCSDSKRTRETLSLALGEALETQKIYYDHRFREIFCGDYEGRSREELKQNLGNDFFHSWISFDHKSQNLRLPGGESKAEHLLKIYDALTEYIENYNPKNILLCAHGGVIKALLTKSESSLGEDKKIRNTEVFKFEFTNKNLKYIKKLYTLKK